jgi:hypothetical protein
MLLHTDVTGASPKARAQIDRSDAEGQLEGILKDLAVFVPY